jgi:hypothetical protein
MHRNKHSIVQICSSRASLSCEAIPSRCTQIGVIALARAGLSNRAFQRPRSASLSGVFGRKGTPVEGRQIARANAQSCEAPPQYGPWTLLRLDLTTTVQPKKWPVCRLKLLHEKRGSVVEIATGAGCLDAVFNAVAQLIGVTAPVRAIDVDFNCAEAGGLPQVTVGLETEVDNGTWRGCARTGDLVLSAVKRILTLSFVRSSSAKVRRKCHIRLRRRWIGRPH